MKLTQIGFIGGEDGPTSIFVSSQGRTYCVSDDVHGIARAAVWTASAFIMALCLVGVRSRRRMWKTAGKKTSKSA